jgi:signal transduction histidine kinase
VRLHIGFMDPISAAVLALCLGIFLFDILTPPENVAISLAYCVAIFVAMYERDSRPLRYAVLTTTLSLLGWLLQPSPGIGTALVVVNLGIAIVMQWLVAILVRLERRRFREAVERVENQRRLVSVLSHEIGTALTIVIGQASRMLKLSAVREPIDLQRRAEKIRNAAQRIELIVERIRFASSFHDGSIFVEFDRVDICMLLRQLKEQFQDEYPGRTIESTLPDRPLIIDGDQVLLRQMFENVILNSVKYTPSSAAISISMAVRKTFLEVTIADEGGGISDYDLSRIRTPYYRGESSKRVSGAGIGLYVVEEIAKAHGGGISIESDFNRGTQVIIQLPRSK